MARVNFCNIINNFHNGDRIFLSSILFTDEARFGVEGVFNLHNEHCWCDENPHLPVEHGFQNRFSINVWAGIIENYLIGPYFFLPGSMVKFI